MQSNVCPSEQRKEKILFGQKEKSLKSKLKSKLIVSNIQDTTCTKCESAHFFSIRTYYSNFKFQIILLFSFSSTFLFAFACFASSATFQLSFSAFFPSSLFFSFWTCYFDFNCQILPSKTSFVFHFSLFTSFLFFWLFYLVFVLKYYISKA